MTSSWPVRSLLLAAALTFVALPALADKVFVDYDHDVDFDGFETFAYSPAKKGMLAQDSQTDQWIVDGIVERLIAGGLRQVDAESDPDLVVAYQMTTQTDQRMDVMGIAPVASMWGSGWGWGPGFGPGWGYGGGTWYTATSMVSSVEVGSLLVAAFDTSTKQGIWRGTAEIKAQRTPHKNHQKIDQALDRMSEKWRKLHERE